MAKRTPSAKNNDGLWHCTNDEARGTIFVKGDERRSASTWPVPASASAVERPWSCTLPPELGLTVCGYLDAPSLARLEISHGLGDQAQRAWEAQAAGIDRGDLGDDVSAKRLVGMHVRTVNALKIRSFAPPPNFDAFVFSLHVTWGPPGPGGRRRRDAVTTATFNNIRLRTSRGAVGSIAARSTFMLRPSRSAHGHAALTPMARQIFRETDRRRAKRLVRYLYPEVDLTCTRIADGAAIKVAGCQMLRLCGDHELGDTSQGALEYTGYVAFAAVADEPRFHLTFDRSTGKLRAMYLYFEVVVDNPFTDDDELGGPEVRPMSKSTFCALLHAGLDESVRRAAQRAAQRDTRPVMATFTSSLDATVRLFWRNPDTGEEVPYGEVTGRDALRRGGPGDGLRLRTHPGHTFRVYRGDELVRSFTVTAPRGGKEAFHLR